MIKNLKKAFTIIELVIVIAVIAILAAVMIPTYSSLVKKANVSKDTQLVRNLNTALATNPDGHKTMSEALASAEANGYDVSKINASATDNEILWDSVNDVFCYLNGDEIEYIPNTKVVKKVEDYQYWQICSEVPSTQKYSIYWNKTSGITKENELTVGFDSGKTYGNDIKYVGTNHVIINTNSSDDLEVDNISAAVSHHGEANFITLTNIDNNSYHEYGNVLGIKLKKGRVVIEKEGKVNNIVVTSENVEDIQIESEGGQIDGIGATEENVKQELKNIVKGVDNNIISDTIVNEKFFKGGLGTESSPYIISSKEEWTALASVCKTENNETDGKYYSITTDLDFSGYNHLVQLMYFYGNLDFNNHKVLNVTLDDVQIKEKFSNAYGSLIFYAYGDVTIKNIKEFNTYSPSTDKTIKLIIRAYDDYENSNNTLILENITITGQAVLADNNTGLFVHFAVTSNIELNNCINKANIYNSRLTGVFIGGTYKRNESDTGNIYPKSIKFTDCKNYGTIITTKNDNNSIAMLISNPVGADSNVYVENCVNYGQMITAGKCSSNNVVTGSTTTLNINGSVTGNQISSVTPKEIKINNNKFNIDVALGASKYVMSFSFSGAAKNGGIASVSFELNEDDLNNVDVYNWKYSTANSPIANVNSENKYGTTVKTVIIDGTTYYVADTANTTNTPVSVVVYAYDASNNIIGYSTYTYTN